MNLLLFIVLAAIYIVTIYLAFALKKQFNLFVMIGFFVLGGVIGAFFNSYEIGFVLAVVLSLVFW